MFRQTVGGRTAIPLPRPVPHPPFVRWQAPLVWTTLALTMNADGSSDAQGAGPSAFPRHWVYGTDGAVAWKSALTDERTWMRHSFGERTPWSDRDREALVTEVESQVERQLSTDIMRGGAKPEIRRLPDGSLLTRQGDPGDELYLLLDGVAVVEVDGRAVAEVGPGAVVGERASSRRDCGPRRSARRPRCGSPWRGGTRSTSTGCGPWPRRTAARTSRWGRPRRRRWTETYWRLGLLGRTPPAPRPAFSSGRSAAAVPRRQGHHARPVDDDAHQHRSRP